MAQKNITFLIQLVNQVSGPAKQASDSTKALTSALGGVGLAITGVNQALELLGKGFDLIGEAMSAALSIAEELFSRFESFQDVAQVFELKEGIAGDKVLKEMLDDMEAVGISVSDAQVIARKLGNEFKDIKAAKELSRVISDIKLEMKLTSSETKTLTDQIVKLGSRSVVGERQARGFEQYFHGADMFKEIAKATGKSIDEVHLALKKGTLPAYQLAAGLRQAQLDYAGVGHAGEAASKIAATSVSAQMERLHSIVYNFGLDFAKMLFGGTDAADGLKKLNDGLQKLLESKDVQDAMKAVADALKDIGKWVIGALPTALKALGTLIRWVGESFAWLKEHTELVKAVLAGFAAIILTVVAVLALLALAIFISLIPLFVAIATIALVGVAIYELIAHWDDLKQAVFRAVGSIGDTISGWVSTVRGKFSEWGAIISGALSSVLESAKAWVTGWYDVGSSIVTGLVNGIKNLAHLPVEAVTSIASGIKNAFKSVLGIASPSVVMEEAGENVSKGVQKGVEQGTPAATGAGVTLGTATQAGVGSGLSENVPKDRTNNLVQPSPSGGNGGIGYGGSTTQVMIDMGGIHITGTDAKELNMETLPIRIRDEVDRGVRLALSRAYVQGAG
jgi:phage-related protein